MLKRNKDMVRNEIVSRIVQCFVGQPLTRSLPYARIGTYVPNLYYIEKKVQRV